MKRPELSRFPLLLLAAGFSERMGSPKGLLDFGGHRWIAEQLERFDRAGGRSRVVVVSERLAPDYLAAVPELGPDLVLNPRPERGQFSSLQLGARALLDRFSEAPGAFVLPIDVPAALPPLWRALAAALSPGLSAAIPVLRDHGGHPLLLARTFLEFLAALDPENPSARLDLLIKRLAPGARASVATEDPRVRLNLNTPEEWARFLSTPH